MNRVILTGNLVADPDVRMTKNDTPVTHFRLAVDRSAKKGEDAKADYISCVAWNGLAKICGQYLQKGRLVAIEGKLRFRSYESNGQKKSVTEVFIDSMQMLDRRFHKAASKEAKEEEIEIG